MKTNLRLTVVALALATGASMSHAEVPKEHKSTFSRAKTSLTSVENSLHTTRRLPTERAVAEAEKRLAKVDELLAKLPASEPDVVELTRRRAAAKAEIDRRRAVLNGVAAEAQAGNAALETGADTDLTTMEAVRARLGELRRALGDTPENDGLELWPRVRDDAAALVEKYKGKRGTTEAARTMERETRMLDSELRSMQRMVATQGAELPAMAARYITMAEKATAPGQDDANIDAFVGAIRNAQRGGALLDKLELLARGEPSVDATGVPALRTRIAAIEARIGAAKAKVIAKTPMPAEGYTGADKEKLRAAIAERWKTTNPRFPAIKVVLDQEAWVRRTEWVYETDRWRKVDVSSLHAFVFIKADATTAHFYAAYLVKDHLAGDRMTVNMMTTSGNPANWSQVIALSKVGR